MLNNYTFDINSITNKIGIDSIFLFIESKYVLFQDSFKQFNQAKYRFIRLGKGIGINIKKIYGNEYVNFSLNYSKLLNKDGIANLNPFDLDDLGDFLGVFSLHLEDKGIIISNPEFLKVGSIDLFCNFNLNDSYSNFIKPISLLSMPLMDTSKYETTAYFNNKSNKLAIYDKTKELREKQNIQIPDHILRIERRINRSANVKSKIKSKYIHEITNNDLYIFFKKTISQLIKWIKLILEKETYGTLKENLASYYSNKKNLNKEIRRTLEIGTINENNYEMFLNKELINFKGKSIKQKRSCLKKDFIERKTIHKYYSEFSQSDRDNLKKLVSTLSFQDRILQQNQIKQIPFVETAIL